MKTKGHHDGYHYDIPLGCHIRHYLEKLRDFVVLCLLVWLFCWFVGIGDKPKLSPDWADGNFYDPYERDEYNHLYGP